MPSICRAGLSITLLAFACMGDSPQAHNAALKPFSFLSGRWLSETPSEVQEEIWSPAIGDSILGSFRVVQHGRPVFYEFWAVELDDHRPVLKLKHFNADLAGWEEKNVSTKLPLISIRETDLVFAAVDGSVSLHYRRGGDTLTCTVHHAEHGKESDETFVFKKAPQN